MIKKTKTKAQTYFIKRQFYYHTKKLYFIYNATLQIRLSKIKI